MTVFSRRSRGELGRRICGVVLTAGLLTAGLLTACQAPLPPTRPSPSGDASAPGPTGRPSPSTTGSPSSSPSSGTGTAACRSLVDGLDLEQRVGQTLMVAVDSGGVAKAAADTLADVEAGSVLLLGNSDAGLRKISQVTDEARAAAKPPTGIGTLLAADQEGGQVQRLSGRGFDEIPSAARQAELSDDVLAERAEGWGAELKEAGIDANLAPVADVVPKRFAADNEPVAGLKRGYGSDPEQVGEKVAAFTKGMAEAGVATSLKHFPGLGRVQGNTDFAADVTDDSTEPDDEFTSFRAGIEAGADMIMISNAFYAKIDPDRQAVFSAKIITGLVRDRLGFDGVVISDDLAAEGVADLSPKRRAVRFIEAGGDLMIIGDPAEAEEMADALSDRAEEDEDFADRITEAATRVVALKAAHGLASCESR